MLISDKANFTFVITMDLGSIIRKYRVLKGYTQEWIAETLGITSATIQNWESSKTQIINPVYFKLCDTLEINPCLPIREMLDLTENELPIQSVSYLNERIQVLEKRSEDLIAENAVLKYKLSQYESGESGSSKKAG